MNLIIDIGNSYTKIAVFQHNEMFFQLQCTQKELIQSVKNITYEKKTEKAIIANVADEIPELTTTLNLLNIKHIELTHQTPLPFINRYATPQSIGKDRLALAAAAVQTFPNQSTLVIDAGTTVTYEFVSQYNEYLGGAISPGLKMRFKALQNFTSRLPLIEEIVPVDFTGNTTKSCIQSGVINGLLSEINGFINHYKNMYPSVNVVLTGGDAVFLADGIKSITFADSNFLLKGLNYILNEIDFS